MPHGPNVHDGRHVAGKTQHNLWRSILWFRSTTIRNYHQRLEHLGVQLHPATRSILCPWGIVCTGPTGPSRRLPHLTYTGGRFSAMFRTSIYQRYTLHPSPTSSSAHWFRGSALGWFGWGHALALSTSWVRIHHLLFTLIPRALRFKNYKIEGCGGTGGPGK